MPIQGFPEEEYLTSGHRGCAGCGSAIAVRLITKVVGKDCIIAEPTGCVEVITTPYPQTAWRVPWIHGAFENVASIASGIRKALEYLGKHNVKVLAIAGDGATFDIGFGHIAGSFERGDRIFYCCCDNEAYMNCLPGDTLIMTKNGLKKLTELKLGEDVYVFNLKTYELDVGKCTGIFNNGIRSVFEVETLHHSIVATPNHPFLTIERLGGKERKFRWKTLKQLRVGDEIIVLKNLGSGNSYKFEFKPVRRGEYKVNKLNEITIPRISTPELLKYLGLFVGDGWVRVRRGEVGFAIPEGPVRRILLELHSKIFGDDGIGGINDFYVCFYSVNLARFINLLDFGNNAKTKTIPAWIFTLPREEKEAFVEGLLLSDGYVCGNSLRYVSSSLELLRKLRLLLQTMGYRVGKIHWTNVKKGEKCVDKRLLKDMDYGYICFSRERKWNLEKYKAQYRYQNPLIENKFFDVEKVRNIRFVGRTQVFDLRVENDHNFIADGIVVHNTGVQRSGATPYAAWTTTTPPGKVSIGKRVWRKDMVEIMAAHNAVYSASASIGYPRDLYKKLRKGVELVEEGPVFLDILTPCPVGWGFPSHLTVEFARLAVETGAFPLYEIEGWKYTLQKPRSVEELKPIRMYLEKQRRFGHLFKPKPNEKVLEFIQSETRRRLERLIRLSER